MAVDLISPEKSVNTYALQPDSTIVLYAHDLNNSKTDNKSLAATGYVLDKERKTLTLSSYDSNPSTATVYHVVYDFDGNLIANDPAKFTLKPVTTGGGTYIWECQNCHKKVNGVTKPKRRSLLEPSTCPCSYDYDWVKIGQVN